MHIVDPKGWNVELAKEQPEYAALRAIFSMDTRSLHNASGEEYNSGPSFTVAFKPTPEELVQLLNGGVIYMRQHGTQFRPVALWTEAE